MLNAKRKRGKPSNEYLTEHASCERINAAKVYTSNILSPNSYLSAAQSATTSIAYSLNSLDIPSVSVAYTNASTYNFIVLLAES